MTGAAPGSKENREAMMNPDVFSSAIMRARREYVTQEVSRELNTNMVRLIALINAYGTQDLRRSGFGQYDMNKSLVQELKLFPDDENEMTPEMLHKNQLTAIAAFGPKENGSE